MFEFSLDEVCLATGGTVQSREGGIQFKRVVTDTRQIISGDLFIALVGERFDGHNFINDAVKKGAAGVIVSRHDVVCSGTTVVLVKDTLTALQQLARHHRKRFNIPIIAVTGSNGKTTTKDMIAAVLASRFNVLKTQANYNNEIGLPLTLLNLEAEHKAAVVEMGMRGKGQITELVRIAEPSIGVVTNVSETHMELLGSIENIAMAKAELVEAIPHNGLVVLNADNEHVLSMKNKTAAKKLLYGVCEQCDIHGSNIRSSEEGTYFDVSFAGQTTQMYISTLGKHNVYNALAAVTVGLSFGLTMPQIQAGLDGFIATAMRLGIEKTTNYTIINDAYNASPASTAAAIESLAQIAQGRKVAVLGDMLELGHIASQAHRQIGLKLAEQGVDLVVTVGTLARHIADAVNESGTSIAIACDNHNEASSALQKYIQPGDTILVKGSRGMKMEKILETLR